MTTIFRDREAGGAVLAEALSKYKGKDVVVYGLPRGGVVTAKSSTRSTTTGSSR